jgi:hypothetical protein
MMMTREAAFRLAFMRAEDWWRQVRWIIMSTRYRHGENYLGYGGRVRRGSV